MHVFLHKYDVENNNNNNSLHVFYVEKPLFQPVDLLYKPLAEFQEELLPQDVPLRTIYNIYDEHEQNRESKLIFKSHVMRKLEFCICENKDADQLCSNCTADQCLYNRFLDSTIPLPFKSEISSF